MNVTRRSGVLCVALCAGLALSVGSRAMGQSSGGQDFGSQRMPIEAVSGDIRFAGARAWAWREGSTQRLVLDRHVVVRLGQTEFEARRAVVWVREVEPEVFQVFAWLEDVRTPTADAAVGIKAEVLPVRAVVRGRPRLSADVRVSGAPASDGALRADERLLSAVERAAESLARAFEVGEPEAERPGLPERREARAPRESRVVPMDEQGEGRVGGDVVRGERGPARREDDVAVDRPRTEQPVGPVAAEGETGGPVGEQVTSDESDAGVATTARQPLFESEGTFFISAGERVAAQGGEDETSVVVTGGVVVQYQAGVESLEITAERAVIFLKPGRLSERLNSFSVEDVEGLYLEGEVRATDGTYTLRGPRIYYDVKANRALVLDAVFWAYDARLGMTLYVRADAVRQEAANQFSAERASLSNTAFFKPDFTVGVRDVTIERRPSAEGGSETYMDAKDITLRAGDVPFFWWPRYRGDPEQIPIRSIGYDDSNRTGGVITSSWDALSLLGIRKPRGLDVGLDFDVYFDRGLGIGTETRWETDKAAGSFLGYMLPNDNGEDVLRRDVTIDREGEFRGMAFARHRAEVAQHWTVLAELSHVSDEAFVTALFPEIARDARELTTRFYARRTEEHRQFSAEVKGSLDDFIIPEHQLQAPGYMVDKLPELKYSVIGNDLLPETAPGLLTHTWEASYANMRFAFSEVTAAELGFTTNRAAQRAFGTDADESLGDFFRSMGLDESFVNRFDTRHEVSMQLRAGELLVTPFVVGRLTHYDDEFEAFSPNETEQTRLWGAAGVTLATAFQRVYRNVESDLLDLHEIRHIVEPSVTVWSGGTTIDREDLPIYDTQVESLLDGTAVEARLGQTFQTKRGGPGRWRSVGVLTFNLAYVWHSDDAGRTTPVGRWVSYQPELSVPGEYVRADATVQLTEALGVTGEAIYDLENDVAARSAVGVLVEHRPDFTTAAELRYLDSEDTTFGRLGMSYRLTDKYRLNFTTTYNFREDDFQSFNVRFFRLFTIGELGLALSYDNLRGETSFGFTFIPFASSGPLNQRSRSQFDDDFGS